MHLANQSSGKPDMLSQGSTKPDKLSQSSMGGTLDIRVREAERTRVTREKRQPSELIQ